MNLLRIGVFLNLYDAFENLKDITREEIKNGSWIDRYEPKICIEKTSFKVKEENEDYYVVITKEDLADENLYDKIYKEKNEDDLCMYCLLWPEFGIHELNGYVYVKENEESIGKQILFSEFNKQINKMIKFCDAMKNTIQQEGEKL